MLLLGIMGSAGAGKDEMAQYLQANYGLVRVALADPIKRVAKEIYGFSNESLWGPSNKRNEPDPRYPREDGSCLTPREVLQLLGTELGRACWKDTWVKKALDTADILLQNDPHTFYDPAKGIYYSPNGQATTQGVVISDVRFKNEVDAIHKAGGVVVRLKRPGVKLTQVGIANHASEKEQLSIPDENVDLVLNAIEGLPHFYQQLDALAKGYKLRKTTNVAV